MCVFKTSVAEKSVTQYDTATLSMLDPVVANTITRIFFREINHCSPNTYEPVEPTMGHFDASNAISTILLFLVYVT